MVASHTLKVTKCISQLEPLIGTGLKYAHALECHNYAQEVLIWHGNSRAVSMENTEPLSIPLWQMYLMHRKSCCIVDIQMH